MKTSERTDVPNRSEEISAQRANADSAAPSVVRAARLRWRVVDTVTAAVLGAVMGVVFLLWNQVGYAAFTALDALTPGVGGIVSGVWLMGGPLGMLVIRKPGAAIFVETLAAIVSMALGSQWGPETLVAGLIQGAAAELIFALFRYRRFGPGVAAAAGGAAALGAMVLEGITHGNFAKSFLFNAIYWSTSVASGIIIAGIGSYFIVRGLARTGALNRFASGRDLQERI